MDLTPENLRDLAMSFQKSRILLSAFELDVFTALGEGARSSREVAETVGADARGTDRLLNALCALGLLSKEKGLYSNTEASRRYLSRSGERYLSGLGHAANLYASWGSLTAAVRAGGTVRGKQREEGSGFSLEAFIGAMHQRALMTAPALVSKIDLSGVRRVLDVGGGSGVYSMSFARAKEGLEAVVFDLPGVTEIARRHIREAGLENRITAVEGNYLTDDLGSGFDMVFFSAVIHIQSGEENRRLIEKSFRALNPEGLVVIQDFVMDEDRTAPPGGAVFALNMLVNTASGDTYTESEIRDWLEGAGFIGVIRQSTGADTSMVIGRKPSV